ncbi:MAG: sugar phosphate isomerase/epimerase [Chthoniobacteraceae bacterium]
MFTRRHFLATTALAALPVSRAAEPAFTLGFSLYGMKTVPLDDALRTCAEIGYKHVELALNPGFPTEPKLLDAAARKALRERLATLKLGVSALMVNMSLAVKDEAHASNLAALKDAAQLAHDLALPDPLIETVLGGKPAEWDAIKDSMLARLRDWAEAAAAAKITLAIKAHVGSAVNSPERLLWLLDQAASPALCAAYDFSHFEVQGLALAPTLDALLPRTKFIHVKDTQGDVSKFQFLLPGEGRTDYAAYFRELNTRGYRGPVVVEVSAQVFNKPGYDPIAAAKKCYAALAK